MADYAFFVFSFLAVLITIILSPGGKLSMPWLKSIPFLSLALVIVAYVAFGWRLAEASVPWSTMFHEHLKGWQIELDQRTILALIHIFTLFIITLTTLALTTPITLMTYVVGNWAKSELRSMVSMVFWCFIFVVALRWFNYFTSFLLLLAAAILGRIELRNLGMGQGQSLLLLALICGSAFAGGVYSYFSYYPLPSLN